MKRNRQSFGVEDPRTTKRPKISPQVGTWASLIMNGILSNIKKEEKKGFHFSQKIRDEKGNTPLLLACKHGHIAIVRYLVNKKETEGPPLDEKNEKGETGFIIACKRNHVELSKYLKSLPLIDITAQDKTGKTGLHFAAECCFPEIAALYCNSEALELTDVKGQTFFHKACIHGSVEVLTCFDTEVLDPLFNNFGVDGIALTIIHQQFEMLTYLLSRDIELEKKQLWHGIALYTAARLGRTKFVSYILSKKYGTCDYLQALESAIEEKHVDIVKLLFCSVNKEMGSYKNEEIFRSVISKGNVALTTFLVRNGCSVDTPNALLCAVRGDHFEVAKYLISQGSDMTDDACMYEAASNGNLEMIRLLLENGFAITDDHSFDGCTLLHCAIESGNIDVVDFMIQEGCDVTVTGEGNRTALHYACTIVDGIHIVQLLLDHGCPIDAQDYSQATCFHIACENGILPIVTLLHKNGSSLYASDHGEWNGLHWAAFNGHVPVIKFLLEQKCDPLYQDNSGATCLHVAANGGHIDLVDYLLSLECFDDHSDFIQKTLSEFRNGCKRMRSLYIRCSFEKKDVLQSSIGHLHILRHFERKSKTPLPYDMDEEQHRFHVVELSVFIYNCEFPKAENLLLSDLVSLEEVKNIFKELGQTDRFVSFLSSLKERKCHKRAIQ